MKNLFLTISLILIPFISGVATVDFYPKKEYKPLPTKTVVHVRASYYHAKAGQTDSTPLITASMKHIDTNRLKSGKLRWCALSRNLLKYFGGRLKWGDTITIYSSNDRLRGKWVVQDCMHEMYRDKIDFLTVGHIAITEKRLRLEY